MREDQFKDLRDRLLDSASEFYQRLGALLEGEADRDSRRVLCGPTSRWPGWPTRSADRRTPWRCTARAGRSGGAGCRGPVRPVGGGGHGPEPRGRGATSGGDGPDRRGAGGLRAGRRGGGDGQGRPARRPGRPDGVRRGRISARRAARAGRPRRRGGHRPGAVRPPSGPRRRLPRRRRLAGRAGRSHYSIAGLLAETGKTAEAVASDQAAGTLRQALVEADPTSVKHRVSLAACLDGNAIAIPPPRPPRRGPRRLGSGHRDPRGAGRGVPDVPLYRPSLAECTRPRPGPPRLGDPAAPPLMPAP